MLQNMFSSICTVAAMMTMRKKQFLLLTFMIFPCISFAIYLNICRCLLAERFFRCLSADCFSRYKTSAILFLSFVFHSFIKIAFLKIFIKYRFLLALNFKKIHKKILGWPKKNSPHQ